MQIGEGVGIEPFAFGDPFNKLEEEAFDAALVEGGIGVVCAGATDRSRLPTCFRSHTVPLRKRDAA